MVWTHRASENYNTICIAAGCYSNCHAPCKSNYLPGGLLGYFCSAFPFNVFGSATCKICNHKANQHRHYKYIHVRKPGHLDEKTKSEWERAHTEEQKLQAAQNASQRAIDRIKADGAKVQDEIGRLIDEYNNISMSRNFAGHVRSALQVLEYRKNELQSKTGTSSELELIDASIEMLKKKLSFIEDHTKSYRREALRVVKGIYRLVVPHSGR